MATRGDGLEKSPRRLTKDWQGESTAFGQRDLLRSCKRRGMRAPVLAVGDGALGFWKAPCDVFADTKEQRCGWHKIGNDLDVLLAFDDFPGEH